jgi:hypothetical protein
MHTLVVLYLNPDKHVETQYQVEFYPQRFWEMGHIETHIFEVLSAYCLYLSITGQEVWTVKHTLAIVYPYVPGVQFNTQYLFEDWAK